MPKRTNEFQSLVHQITRQLQPLGAKIEESRLLVDKTMNKQREVDIVVQLQAGPHPVVICLECYSGKRPADVGWVDRMHATHQALNTNKLVLVSRKGFTRDAAEKAKHYGHEAVSIRDASKLDWRSIADTVPQLGMRVTILPEPQKVLLAVSEEARERASSITDYRNLFVVEPSKSPISLLAYVRQLIHKDEFIDALEKQVPFNESRILRATIALPQGTLVRDCKVGDVPVVSLYVEAPFRRVEIVLGLQRLAYGDDCKIALGNGTLEGFPITMSVSETTRTPPELRVNFPRVSGGKRLEIVGGRFVLEQ